MKCVKWFVVSVTIVAFTSATAYAVVAPQVSAANSYYMKQGAPFGHTIYPQGTWAQGDGFIFDRIEVEIGTVANNVFTPVPGFPVRIASITTSTWTAAAYTNLNASTNYNLRVRLWERPMGNPPGASAVQATTVVQVPTGP